VRKSIILAPAAFFIIHWLWSATGKFLEKKLSKNCPKKIFGKKFVEKLSKKINCSWGKNIT
jgi:hypothetical protein